MRRICELPIWAVFLALAWLPGVQARQSEAPMVEANGPADPGMLRKKADAGDRGAQYRLGEAYRIGLWVAQDHVKAIELYNRSAGQGFAASQFRLGEIYDAGELAERDLGQAIEFYRLAAEQGHPGAQYALAHIYHLGSGVAQNMAAAMAWYRKAALQGDEWSQLALGDQYRIGLAVPRDLAQSTEWYRRAAERGNIFAQFELGNAYRFGNGIERDASQAMAWYRLSAEAGNPSAKLALAELETGAADMASATASATDHAKSLVPESGGAPKATSSAPASDAAATDTPDAELAYAAEPSYSERETVSQLLSLAEGQVAKLAFTTPEGDNAYETYRLILSIQPNNEAALAGIERIGIVYSFLAEQAAAKGDLRKARHYVAKAEELAPDNSFVQSMAIPAEAEQPASKETIPDSETVESIETPRRALVEPQEATPEIEVAAPASVSPNSLVRDVDDLIFRPDNYQGRQVVVTGSVIHLLWDYRLKAETGQNSIVIDVDGLSPGNRAMLDAAIEGVGLLGQIRARVKGRVKRQTPATFELVVSELTLIGFVPEEADALAPDPGPKAGAAPAEPAEPAEPVNPVAPLVQANGSARPISSGDGRGTGGPPPAYVPACYQDAVWRRLPDGRIQTGTRTRCF